MCRRHLLIVLIFTVSWSFLIIGCTDYKQDSIIQQDFADEEELERNVIVYYVDGQTAAIKKNSVKIKNEYDIWMELQNFGVVTEDCELLSLEINLNDKTLNLDFNSSTGDLIRNMGSTGEIEIIGCIVNTYLEAYDSNGIRLTEEGTSLETSHGGVIEGYCGYIDL